MGLGTSACCVGVVSQAHADRIYLGRALHTYPRTTIAGVAIPFCVSPSLAYCRRFRSPSEETLLHPRGRLVAVASRYRNINLLSIDYACRPRLRSRLTLGG